MLQVNRVCLQVYKPQLVNCVLLFHSQNLLLNTQSPKPPQKSGSLDALLLQEFHMLCRIYGLQKLKRKN
jgi:hypothetical protein